MSHVADNQFGPIMDLECENGTVHWAVGKADIVYSDGSSEEVEDGPDRMRTGPWKNMINALRNDEHVISSLEVGRTQTLCINGAHESCPDVHGFPPSVVSEVSRGDQRFRVVAGLEELLHQSADEGKLFSELGLTWAKESEPYSLRDYSYFPASDSIEDGRKKIRKAIEDFG